MDVTFQRSMDTGQHIIEVFGHLVVPESEHDIPVALEILRALVIVGGGVRVLSTVQLDNQLLIHADEVDDVRSDGMLSPEFAVEQLALA